MAITRAQIPSTNISAVTFTVSGYSTSGDSGVGAIYSSSGATSDGPGAVQDAIGTWFNLRFPLGEIVVGWFGAKGDASFDASGTVFGTDDTAEIQAMTIAQNVTRMFNVTFPSATTCTIQSMGIFAAGA